MVSDCVQHALVAQGRIDVAVDAIMNPWDLPHWFHASKKPVASSQIWKDGGTTLFGMRVC